MKKRDVGLMMAIVGLVLVIVSLVTIFDVEDVIYISTTGKVFQTDYCTSSCAGKACGADDGCGNPCQIGSCPTGQTCSSGTCVAGNTCTPSCSGKECGSDGCGGSCGNCSTGLVCIDGSCIESEFECSDTIDNDADQLIDDKDPGCWSYLFDSSSYNPSRNDESGATTQCQDNLDNDGDGLIDENDPECLVEGNYDLTDNDESDGTTPDSSGPEWYSEKTLFSGSNFNIIIWIILGGLLAVIGGSIYFFVWKSRKKNKNKGKTRKKKNSKKRKKRK